MDLVAGVRKEGSRGGRGEFKWDDVKENQHRENYLGHSLMARESISSYALCVTTLLSHHLTAPSPLMCVTRFQHQPPFSPI